RPKRDRESSTAEVEQNLHRCRRTGSPGRGSASPEDDSFWVGAIAAEKWRVRNRDRRKRQGRACRGRCRRAAGGKTGVTSAAETSVWRMKNQTTEHRRDSRLQRDVQRRRDRQATADRRRANCDDRQASPDKRDAP